MFRNQSPHESPDVIWGAEAIGKEINRTPRQTWHLLEKGHLPARKIGGLWAASRTALRRTFSAEQAA